MLDLLLVQLTALQESCDELAFLSICALDLCQWALGTGNFATPNGLG